ncbi:GT-D fold domain-containing glycosyltransferase [Lactobacillus helveticus]|uniref:GT-D fold domain-containing glycosyltransferase n=1 Tax=Lactobacillus helveticus TaxID=1587 RepID=UPI0019F10B08|nr:GT-D fold domain-containing glycosyltransferase [Lactobacillus helveticus]NRO18924.1 hypothetical protein [Lactobacillus helveticus]
MENLLNKVNSKLVNTIKNIGLILWSKNKKYNISVLDNYESLKLIKNKQLSVIRFGDGELDLIRGCDIPYQNYNPMLANKMKNLILKKAHLIY